MISHPFGVAGLALNVAGAVLLLKYPPGPNPYTADGIGVSGTFAELPKSDEQRQDFIRRHWHFIYSVRRGYILLILGFSLQAIDLLIA